MVKVTERPWAAVATEITIQTINHCAWCLCIVLAGVEFCSDECRDECERLEGDKSERTREESYDS